MLRRPVKKKLNIIVSVLHFVKTILNILLYPLELLYNIVSSRAVSFLVNLGLILLLIIIYANSSNFAALIEAVDMKIGGISKITCNKKTTIPLLRKSVVRVVGAQSEGTGFSYMTNKNATKSYILTNFHVIEFEPSPKVLLPDNTPEKAQIIAADKYNDLAVLMVETFIPPLSWGKTTEISPGDELLATGFAFGSDLVGESTVKQGVYAGDRSAPDSGIRYIQTDATINPGMSGGPLSDICGKVVGVNTIGAAGFGMAISSEDIKNTLVSMTDSDEPLKDVKKIIFEPDKSPLDAVMAFYNFVKIRRMKEAYALLSDNFLKGGSFGQWNEGYRNNLDTSIIMAKDNPQRKDVVLVKLSTRDAVGEEIITKYFEGWWEVREENGYLKLYWPDIREVENPLLDWFYE